MAEAGLADGFSDELLVRFGISYQKAALTAQQDLAQIGIDIEVNTVDTATIVNRRNSREYSVMAFPSSTAFDDPDGYWARFQCDNPSNYFGLLQRAVRRAVHDAVPGVGPPEANRADTRDRADPSRGPAGPASILLVQATLHWDTCRVGR